MSAKKTDWKKYDKEREENNKLKAQEKKEPHYYSSEAFDEQVYESNNY